MNPEPKQASLKFAAQPQQTLAKASETGSVSATVRYGDEKSLARGSQISLLTARKGRQIGVGTVLATETVPVREALDVVDRHSAKYGFGATDSLITALNQYYDTKITELTEVKVIIIAPTLEAVHG